MTAHAFDPSFDALPETLPIFPLTGVLLLPRAKLPLNIFEPRYLNMTFDAMAGERLIGIIQPRAAADDGEEPPIYETGCAGRIVSFTETEDGRLLIALRGVCRFVAAESLPGVRGYRRVRPDFGPFRDDLVESDAAALRRDDLVAALHAYFDVNGMKADWSVIEQTPNEALVSTLAMICPFAPLEKQALLECGCAVERADMMIALMEMRVRAGESEGEGRAH